MNEFFIIIKSFFSQILSILSLIFTPVFKFLGSVYNFIQTTPFFTTNLFNFILVLLFFVWLLFFKLDIIGLLDKKSKETIKTITDSQNHKLEAQKYLSETQKSFQTLDKDIKKIVSDANNIATNIQKNSQTKIENELENLKTREIILKEAHINKTKDEISAKISKAAIAISKEYIKNSLDENTHNELILNFINSLNEGDIL